MIHGRLNTEGRKNLMEIRECRYAELFIEFLASFSLDKKGIDYEKPGFINFQLGGK